jgi:hypothetical protein
MVLSRTVELSALAVLVGLLVGVELAGFLGALPAIPVIGVAKVVWRDLYDHHHGRLKPEPTVGSDQVPASEAPPEREPAEPGGSGGDRDEPRPAGSEPADGQAGVRRAVFGAAARGRRRDRRQVDRPRPARESRPSS